LSFKFKRIRRSLTTVYFQSLEKFDLDFHQAKFTVANGNLIDLFGHQQRLLDAASYEVQGSVPVDFLELFVQGLETGGKFPLTKENSGSISLLVKELWLEDLLSDCSTLDIDSTPVLTKVQTDLNELKPNASHPVLGVSSSKSLTEVEFRLKEAKSLNGIIFGNTGELFTITECRSPPLGLVFHVQE
jgi:hypothetical protein